MARPQIEDGFTRIANELLKAMARAEIKVSEFMVMLAIINKTYGWNKTKDRISFGELSQITGIERSNCNKVVKNLLRMKMIGVVTGNHTTASTYWIQKGL